MKKPGTIFAMWVGVGVALGVVLHQLALWIGVGVAIGAAEASLARRRKSQSCGAAGQVAKRS